MKITEKLAVLRGVQKRIKGKKLSVNKSRTVAEFYNWSTVRDLVLDCGKRLKLLDKKAPMDRQLLFLSEMFTLLAAVSVEKTGCEAQNWTRQMTTKKKVLQLFDWGISELSDELKTYQVRV